MDRADASPARLYRRLLRLYPSAFRARYEDEMVRLFEDQLRDVRAAGEPAGIARLWLRVLGDLAVTAASERAGRDRTVAHSLSTAPSTSSRVLGLLGVVGGLLLVAAFVPSLPWTQELTQLRLVAFNVGAIAIATAVHRRQVPVAPRASLVAAGAVALANAWYLAMIVLSIGRPVFPDPDPEFRQVAFWAGVAMWWADAAFGIVTWRLRSATRLGAGALAVGSVLAFLGMGPLELVTGPWGWLLAPLALLGLALNGLGWIVLGLDLALRRRPASPAIQPPADRPPGT